MLSFFFFSLKDLNHISLFVYLDFRSYGINQYNIHVWFYIFLDAINMPRFCAHLFWEHLLSSLRQEETRVSVLALALTVTVLLNKLLITSRA